MIERLEVTAGPGTVIRYGGIVAWADLSASSALISFLAQSARNLGPSARGGRQIADHIAGVLAARDPEPSVAFAVVGPSDHGWASLLHGPVQAWDGARWLAPSPIPGWLQAIITPRPSITVSAVGAPMPALHPDSMWDLEAGVVPGAGFVMVPGGSPGRLAVVRPPIEERHVAQPDPGSGPGSGPGTRPGGEDSTSGLPVDAQTEVAPSTTALPAVGATAVIAAVEANHERREFDAEDGPSVMPSTERPDDSVTEVVPVRMALEPDATNSAKEVAEGRAEPSAVLDDGGGLEPVAALEPDGATDPTTTFQPDGATDPTTTFEPDGATDPTTTFQPDGAAEPTTVLDSVAPPPPAAPPDSGIVPEVAREPEPSPVPPSLPEPPARRPVAPGPAGSLDLRAVTTPAGPPLPFGGGPDQRIPGAPVVAGVLCSRGHLNRPGMSACARCHTPISPSTKEHVSGTRPPLGVLVTDDGAVYRLDRSYLIGSRSDRDPTVGGGLARPLTLTGSDVSGSHAELRLTDWDVTLVDRGSAAGTCVFEPGAAEWARLTPYEPRVLRPGTHMAFGQRVVTLISPWVNTG